MAPLPGSRRAGLVLLLALVLLATLSATTWAAWGTKLRSNWLAGLEARTTATPTRTPRPNTETPTIAALVPVVVAFTPTPVPVATAIPSKATSTSEPMPPDLVAVVQRYGMDPARRFIAVSQDAQQMTIWDPNAGVTLSDKLRRLPISTGDESRGFRTPAWYGLVGRFWGTFNAFGVFADEGWYLYEDNGSILIHGAPYKLIDGQKVYQELDALGNYPASRGCIRLTPEDARWFTRWDPQGVPLVVLPRTRISTPLG